MNNVLLNKYGVIDTPIDVGCQRCTLKDTRTNIVRSYIPPNAEIVIIGEAPGETEDCNPENPFCGTAGNYLEQCMRNAGMEKYTSEIGYTNLVRCRPKDTVSNKKNRPVRDKELRTCGDYLEWELANTPNRKVIVCLGDVVAKRILGKTGLTLEQLRGKIIPTERYGNVIVTFHPGMLTRVKNILERNIIRDSITSDLYLAKKAAHGEGYQKEECNYFVTKNIEQVRWAFEQLRKVNMFTFDTETSSFEPYDTTHEIAGHDSTITCFSFGFYRRTAVTIPIVGRDWDVLWTPEEKEEIYQGLREIFSTPHIKKVGQNGKFDLQHMAAMGIYVRNFYADTMIMHYLLDENSRHDLKSLAIRFTDLGNYDDRLEAVKIEVAKERGRKKDELGYQELPAEILWEYANCDVDATYRLYEIFLQALYDEDLFDIFFNLYMPLTIELAYIEFKGVNINKERLDAAIIEYTERIKKLHDIIIQDVNIQLLLKHKRKKYRAERIEKWLSSTTLQKRYTRDQYASIKEETIVFNIGSTDQLGELFINTMGLQPVKLTKTGGASFDDEALGIYAKRVPLANKINEHNKLTHFLDTFLLGIKSRLAEDGHLHTSFNVHIAKTGRLSSSNPNLQNIPNIYKSPVEAKLIRDIFIPDEGHVLIHADYSQAEFRIWGQLSDDKALRRDLEAGMDVHTKVAMQGYNITAEVASTGDYRLNAKTVVFGNMYGRGLPSVAEQLGISLTQAQAIQDILFKNYPEAAKWLDDTKKQAKRDKYIVGLFGQKRHLSGLIDHWNKEIRAKAERQCVNSPIQGSASQMTCFAAIKIARALREHKLDARVILLIHDAIMVTARIDHRDKAIELMRECMLDPHPKVRIPLKVDVEVGPAWGTLSKLKKVLEEEALAIDNNNNQNNI